MTTDNIEENKSRWSVLSDIRADLQQVVAQQKRLEGHMINLTKAVTATRQMSEEDRAANDARFPAGASGYKSITAGSRKTGAPLAAGNKHARHGRTGPIRFLPGYISESFL